MASPKQGGTMNRQGGFTLIELMVMMNSELLFMY
ncbi:prepilin-type N-terminal cleavage/methylation domain-containing protein [Cronobacter sakazakii]|nr:prepilin-type N-terminal cleavage/methylation domain-containing protein [Cronobacter sakazakii]EJQ2008116.1 prepilin-type N-terminal cleavage/methylation domain-containing protein [Cronobacter sakazakii]EJQ2089870.1 prepilin-type N-terminal cleavage/methylation domain-containing protein [Cronobacter sakazakii]EJR9311038.1 prepilin-type N-terminal cleavage/methylation domain-containing protein [Cronobacter sakazakii]EJR9315664.1 prepilin-type N-terminal cleavage/methylation domain-containing 